MPRQALTFRAESAPKCAHVTADPYERRKCLRTAKSSHRRDVTGRAARSSEGEMTNESKAARAAGTNDAHRDEAATRPDAATRPEAAARPDVLAAPADAARPDAVAFEAHRALLFSIAYRMLGSASEAEDVVQDAWLRYASSAPADVRSLRAWLGTVVTRLCLDRLKSAHAQREHYVGPWLPEPVLQADREPSLARAVEQRESTTLAFLVLLESLTAQERAVFVLREAFDYEYAEIAEMLDLTPATQANYTHCWPKTSCSPQTAAAKSPPPPAPSTAATP